jgi:hypothetical protein
MVKIKSLIKLNDKFEKWYAKNQKVNRCLLMLMEKLFEKINIFLKVLLFLLYSV